MRVSKRKHVILRSIVIAATALMLLRRCEQTQIRRRRWWVHPVNRTRDKLGEFDRLYADYRNHPEKF